MKILHVMRWLLIVTIIPLPVNAANLPVSIGAGGSVGAASVRYAAPARHAPASYLYRNGGRSAGGTVHDIGPGGGPPVMYDRDFFKPAESNHVPILYRTYVPAPTNPAPFQLCVKRGGEETCNWHTPR